MIYRIARALVLSACKVLFRVRVQDKHHVPTGGVYIVAASHRSVADIPLAAFVTRRRLRFLAKRELFDSWFGARLFGALGAISVDRDGVDRAALRSLQEALGAGEPVAIFPEGTRNTGGELGPLGDGAAYLALRAGVPLLPVGIGGSERLWRGWGRPGRVVVTVGPAVLGAPGASSARRRDVAELTEQLRRGLQEAFADATVRASA